MLKRVSILFLIFTLTVPNAWGAITYQPLSSNHYVSGKENISPCPLMGNGQWLMVNAAYDEGLKLPPYKKVKLKNGLTVLLMEQREIPIISFSFIVKAGSTADPAGKEGVASLTASLLRKGTKSRSSDQLSAELDFIGGQLGAGVDYDYTSGRAEFLKKDIGKGLDLFADTLLSPTFPADEVTKLLKQTIDGAKSAKDQAGGVIGDYFAAYL